MKKIYFPVLLFLMLSFSLEAQVRSNYLYSTTMPYGTLDIRTNITSTNYYYLKEAQTFSYRESSPGVRTNTYLDMTSWDSSPYGQGHLRQKNGTADKFVMNYRLLPPLNYNSTYSPGYPLLILFHGGAERANCYYASCYHATWSYDPNVNSPAAPKTATHKLLNNDHSLLQGGKQHMDARNLAAGKLPNDVTLAARAFPGFVLIPQMMNTWDSLNVQDAIRLVQLVAKRYNIDEDRIYVDGLSIGGYAAWQAMKRAPWLFAAGIPISAVHDANIIKQNMAPKMATVQYWVFQGALDKKPTPAYTTNLINNLKNAGAVVKYTQYSDLGHTCWNRAFGDTQFYKWMLAQNKSNIHPYKGITNIVGTAYPKLMLAEGFHKYQWEKDGVIISTATTNTYIARAPGKYRARFSRIANPTATQWNKWSLPITITSGSASMSMASVDSVEIVQEGESFSVEAFPNPASTDDLTVIIRSPEKDIPIRMQLLDPMGKPVFEVTESADRFAEGVKIAVQDPISNGMYIVVANQGRRVLRQKVIIKK